MRKLNKKNMGVLVLYVMCIATIVYDFTFITITTIMGITAGWTWLGFITLILAGIFADFCKDYLQEILRNKRR